MKVAETKIYVKFIGWFILVSFLPLVILFAVIYIFYPESSILVDPELQKALFIGIFVSLAFVFLLSLLATRNLAKSITKPINISVKELGGVVNTLFKSIQNISDISQNNSEISQFLTATSKKQQSGLKKGTKAVAEMVQSLTQIVRKTKTTTRNVKKIDVLASESEEKSQLALDSLVAVKHLATDNQKLTQALNDYANQVKDIAKRVEVLADTAKFLSLNVSIEADKTSFSEDFSGLVAQIRELNNTSESAATSIQALAGDMQRQIQHAKESAVYEWQETDKSIKVVSQTINFLSKIVSNVGNISKSVEVINKETGETQAEADHINAMIKDLNKEANSLVKQIDDISQIIYKQLTLTKSLNKSSAALNKVTDTLDNLVGEK